MNAIAKVVMNMSIKHARVRHFFIIIKINKKKNFNFGEIKKKLFFYPLIMTKIFKISFFSQNLKIYTPIDLVELS